MTVEAPGLSEDPPKKRKRTQKSQEARVSIENYVGGRKWEPMPAERRSPDQPLVIRNKLYRFPMHNYPMHRAIEASDDYGATWYSYSQLPHDIAGFAICTLRRGSIDFVYIIGGQRSLPFDDHDSRFCPTAEVWCSVDLMKTFFLMTSDAGFGPVYDLSVAVRSNREIIISGRQKAPRYEEGNFDTWISTDGKSWTLTGSFRPPRYSVYVDGYMRMKRGSLLTYKNKLFATREVVYRGKATDTLVESLDDGRTWQVCDFQVNALISDTLSDRLIGFTNTECFEQLGGCGEWLNLGNEWRKQMLTLTQQCKKLFRYPSAICFSDGVIRLSAETLTDGNSHTHYVLSRPDRSLAYSHKAFVSLCFAQLGIDTALFRYKIIPLLFPY